MPAARAVERTRWRPPPRLVFLDVLRYTLGPIFRPFAKEDIA